MAVMKVLGAMASIGNLNNINYLCGWLFLDFPGGGNQGTE